MAIETKRLVYIDLLRILAIFSVVVLHVSGTLLNIYPIASTNWEICNIYNSFVRSAVPLFVMISGIFFLDQREIPMEKLFGKYILRISTAFITWSAFYAFFDTIVKNNSVTPPIMIDFIYQTLNGHYHMWFCFMIVGLYLIVPFLKKVTSDILLTEYILSLSLIFAILIPTLKLMSFKPLTQLLLITDKFQLFFVLGFVFYFIGGYYLHNNPVSHKKLIIIYSAGIIGYISTVIFTSMVSFDAEALKQQFYGSLTINVMCITLAVFCLFEDRISKVQFKEKTVAAIVILSECSFFIYLFHIFVLKYLMNIGIPATKINPIIYVPGMTILIFSICVLVGLIIRKIPYAKSYIM